jgi:hypothetical protein
MNIPTTSGALTVGAAMKPTKSLPSDTTKVCFTSANKDVIVALPEFHSSSVNSVPDDVKARLAFILNLLEAAFKKACQSPKRHQTHIPSETKI